MKKSSRKRPSAKLRASSKNPGIHPTITAAARAIGKDRRTLGRWKNDGCSAFLADGTVDAVILDEWNRAANELNAKCGSLTEARKALVEIQTRTAQLRFDKEAAVLVLRTEVHEHGAAVGRVLNSGLASFAVGWAPKLAGKTELEIQEAVTTEVDHLIARLRREIQATTGAIVEDAGAQGPAPESVPTFKERLWKAINRGIQGTADQMQGDLELNDEKFAGSRWLYEQKVRAEFAKELDPIFHNL